MLKSFINVLTSILVLLLSACATTGNTVLINPQAQPIPETARNVYSRAVWSAESGLYDEAIALFSSLTRDHPTNARMFTNLGMLHLQKKELTAAEQALSQAVKLYPYDAIAQNHLGVTLRELGKFNEAEQAYLLAIKYNDRYDDAYLNLGILYDLYLHDLTKAIVYYKKAQSILVKPDKLLQQWIIDVERQVGSMANIENG